MLFWYSKDPRGAIAPFRFIVVLRALKLVSTATSLNPKPLLVNP